MPRILAIDYGAKRCGLAETDDLQIIASKVGYCQNSELESWVNKYLKQHKCDTIVMGEPVRFNGEHPEVWEDICAFAEKIKTDNPGLKIEFVNEQFSSKRAMESMVQMGMKKSKRREKGNLDAQSATIILQDYLNQRAY